MTSLKEIYQKKGEAVKAYRDIVDKVDKEEREYTAEEKGQLDTLEKTIEDCDAQAKPLEEAEQYRQKASTFTASLRQPVLPGSLRLANVDDERLLQRPIAEQFREAIDQGMSRREALAHVGRGTPQQRRAFGDALNTIPNRGWLHDHMRERAALRLDSEAAGGALIGPEQFVARLIQDLDKLVFVRGLATVMMLSGAETIGVPTLATDMSDTNWTTELGIGTADTAMAFGKRRLTPHPLAKPIRVSKDLLRTSTLSVEAIVRERMAYKFATVQETAFLSGSGAQQPLGVFTASSHGISTSQDESTGNTTTAITADGLINCVYKLQSQWLTAGNLRWVFHRDAIKMIRKLKDGDGQYLWQPGLQGGQPNSILNYPVIMSEFAPNTFTTGLYVGILGDFSYYWIVDTFSMEIQRLIELYAATNEDGFFGRMKLDGAPVLETAFARVKLG